MNNKKEQLYSYILLAVSLLFYLFFAFYDGAVICVDSPTYIEMSVTREYLYPTILALFRMIFGEQYLLAVVVLQSVLAAYAAWDIAMYCHKRFSVRYILTTVIFLIPVFVSLLNRYVAGRGSMYSNSIMTEGITMPLFLIFIHYTYEYLVSRSKLALLTSAVIACILISCRKQMYITVALLFVIIVYHKLTESGVSGRKKWKLLAEGVIRATAVSLAVILSFSLLDHTYNLIVRDRFVGHSSDNRFVLTMVMYTAEEEYEALLPEEIQPLYAGIYDVCEEKGYLMHSAEDGWYAHSMHFEDHYDLIQINTMWPAIQDYAEHYSNGDSTQRQLVTDEITAVMISHLMPECAPKIIQVLVNNFLVGLVTTIAQMHTVLIYYSVIAYLGYLGLMGFYISKVKRVDETILFCLLTLLSVAVNVGLVSAVIFCQARYTIYNMPLFYISGLLLLKAVWDKCIRKRRLGE